MAQRFAAASQLVDCCRSLGFKGSLGYQTILYSNVNELRRLLMWLIEHIPKSEDKTDALQPGTVHKGKSIENEFLGKLTSDLKRPWALEFLQPTCNDFSASTDLIHYRQDLPEVPQLKQWFELPVFDQTRDLTSNLGSPLVHEKSAAFETQDELKPKAIDLLADSISGLKQKIEEEEVLYRQLTSDLADHRKAIEVDGSKVEQLKQQNKFKSRIALLLDEPEESKAKLLYSLQAGDNKRKLLNDKFESHKQSLEAQLGELQSANSGKVQKSEVKIEEKQKLKLKTQTFQEDLKNKIQLLNQLKTSLAQTRKAADRSQYTSRIFDIIKSIEKQNIDIAGIIKETKSVQKAINSATGQNQRQFTVTEDIIWNNVSCHSKEHFVDFLATKKNIFPSFPGEQKGRILEESLQAADNSALGVQRTDRSCREHRQHSTRDPGSR